MHVGKSLLPKIFNAITFLVRILVIKTTLRALSAGHVAIFSLFGGLGETDDVVFGLVRIRGVVKLGDARFCLLGT